MNNTDDLADVIEAQRRFFASGETKDVEFRLTQLKLLRKAILENEKEILEALKKDLNKAPFEAYATEVGMVLEEIRHTIKNLASWAKPKAVKTPIAHFLSKSVVYSEPYGVVLIMSPWNYPFQLAMTPLIGAIAAGNCAVVKPSAYSFNTSEILDKLVTENFDKPFISVIKGGREENQALLVEKFDYIFFTGSVSVGKTVMAAASKNLTPVTLELGGKSPCIVDESANVELAAKRIVWGKFLNAGQTCVAPDYLLVHKSMKTELISKMKKYINEFWGDTILENKDYPKIINEKHFNRLKNLMTGGNVAFGGGSNLKTMQIEPTILDEITFESPIMQDEIFGPILPVIEFEDLNQVIYEINKRLKPLALYCFTTCNKRKAKIIKNISFGGGCVNDAIVHLANSNMPFGGVGDSGMGGYHGQATFDTFSHKKSILEKSNLLDVPLRYPPYRDKLGLIRKIMR